MKHLAGLLLGGTALTLTCAPLASAQTQAEAAALAEDGYEVQELVVTASGQRVLPGSVVGEAVPEITLDPAEIRALGVSSVEELLSALGPQVASGRGRGSGRPVVLLNGVRVSSFREVRDIPPEAIMRVEVLPEEVSLRYGYPADQRVVNFVLRRRFAALTAETDWSVPTAGGQSTQEIEGQVLRLAGDSRTQVNIELQSASSLLESERDVARTDGQDGALRTLSPASRSLEVNAVYARPLSEGVSASLNAAFETSDTESRLGPSDNPYLAAGELDPLRRMNDSSTAHLGGAVNGAVSGWRWSLTANADRETSRSLTEVAYDAAGAPQAPTQSRSTTTSADIEALLNGGLFELPAGQVNAALTLGASTLDLQGEAFRAGVTRDTDLGRDLGRAQLNLDAPLLDGGDGALGLIGKVSANLNAEVKELSDFGTLTTVGGGLTWSPIDQVRLIASVTDEDGAPTVSQLGAPETVTPGVRVFDFTRGETVEVTQISGGNPNLSADNRQVLKLGLTLKPLDDIDLMFRADYTRQRLTDEIASFPAATAEIEAAFPDRFVRDATGQLIRIDNRAVNFARHDTEELRWGFHYSRRLSSPTAAQGGGQSGGQGAGQARGAAPDGPPPEGGPPPGERAGGGSGGPPGGGGGFGPPGGGRFGPGGGGNLQLAVFHTWKLKDEVLIRDGVPVLDLLDGDTLSGGSLSPRHQVQVQAGVSKNGLGARVEGTWSQGGEVDSALSGSGLTFSDLTTLDLRLFADLGQQPMAREHPWMRGARVSLSVENLFDERLDVRDATGAVPISYQPDLLDPQGRVVQLSFRKLFLPPRAVRRVE